MVRLPSLLLASWLTARCERPFWISPRQVIVIPVAAPHKEYAIEVQKILWDAGLFAEVDLTDNTLNKKIRNGEIAQHNFILSTFSLPPPCIRCQILICSVQRWVVRSLIVDRSTFEIEMISEPRGWERCSVSICC